MTLINPNIRLDTTKEWKTFFFFSVTYKPYLDIYSFPIETGYD